MDAVRNKVTRRFAIEGKDFDDAFHEAETVKISSVQPLPLIID